LPPKKPKPRAPFQAMMKKTPQTPHNRIMIFFAAEALASPSVMTEDYRYLFIS
jgi:hypothetical protein